MKHPIPSANRRGGTRKKPQVYARFSYRRGSAAPEQAQALLDVSETGVRFLSASPMEPGDEVEAIFLGLVHYQPVRRTAEVVWSVPTAGGACCVGALFRRRLTHVDLRHLVAPGR